MMDSLFLLQPISIPYNSIIDAAIPFTLTIPLWISIYGGIMQYADFMKTQTLNSRTQNQPEEYDFIIVGGGSSGCVLANRLSEHFKVLLLELGGDPNPIARLGISYYVLQRSPSTDLLYETVPQKNAALALHNQKVFWPRGTGLGGSSNLNAMIYQRGNPNDYDNWANITGEEHWSWNNVLPYFKKLEDYQGTFPNKMFHGNGGPIHIERVRQSYMENYFLKAAEEKGYPIKDLNSIQTTGFSPNDVTMKNGLRWGTYFGYIRPILSRKNLVITRYSRVIKIHFDENMNAIGVTYVQHGIHRYALTRKEIILSAGAVDSPKILMLSGIGPKNHLESYGIETLVDLPVGENLQDHTLTLLGPIRVDTPESLIFKRVLKPKTLIDFALNRRGPLVSTTHSAIGYVSTAVRNYDESWPDIQFTLASLGLFKGLPEFMEQVFNIKSSILRQYFYENGNDSSELEANIIAIALQRPKGRGHIKLASSDPFVPPLMDPMYLQHPDDVKAYVEGVRILVDLFENSTVYKRINARLMKPFPGCEHVTFKSDDYYECYIRHITTTIYHPVGTTSMGKINDKTTVVDPYLRVKGTNGLRVVDASIMPTIVNANTNIPCIMIAELASDLIKAYWKKN